MRLRLKISGRKSRTEKRALLLTRRFRGMQSAIEESAETGFVRLFLSLSIPLSLNGYQGPHLHGKWAASGELTHTLTRKLNNDGHIALPLSTRMRRAAGPRIRSDVVPKVGTVSSSSSTYSGNEVMLFFLLFSFLAVSAQSQRDQDEEGSGTAPTSARILPRPAQVLISSFYSLRNNRHVITVRHHQVALLLSQFNLLYEWMKYRVDHTKEGRMAVI